MEDLQSAKTGLSNGTK